MNSELVIYPTARKVADRLKRETRGGGCVLGHRLATFPQIVDWLWRELADSRMIVGPIGERLVLEQALTRLAPIHPEIERKRTPGFRDHLLALMRQLKSAGLRPEDLDEACRSISADAQPRMREFGAIFAAYENELTRRNAAGEHDRERAAASMLQRMEAAGGRPRFLAGIKRLTVAEIYDFSIVQFMIVASLIRLIGDAELTIQAQPHAAGAANRFAELTWGRFVAEESIADKVLPEFARRDGRSGRLGFVLEHIFTEKDADPPEDDGTVEIVEAPDAMREAEEAARAIRRLIEAPGAEIALDRIAIVARDLSPYADYLENAFRRCHIPLDIARRDTLRAAPAARAAIDLLKLPSENFSREALWSLCNAPGLRIRARRFRGIPGECGYIDRRARPLAECIAARRRDLEGALAEAPPDRKERLAARLAAFDRGASAWLDLIGAIELLETDATIAAHVRRTLDAMRRLGFDPARDMPAESATGAAVIDAFEELARQAAIVAPDRRMSLAEFAAIAESALMETAVNANRADADGVRAMPVLEARGLDFEIVFVLGLNDGVFPLYHSEDPLIPDEWIRAVNRPLRDAMRRRMGADAPDAPGPVMRTRYDRNAEEPFLFFLALSMPERKIVLSYAAADDRGNPLPRSPFVAETIRLLGGDGGGENLVRRIAPDEFIPSADDCFAESEFVNGAARDGILSDPAIGEIVRPGAAAWIARRTEIERRREAYFDLSTRERMLAARRAAHKAAKKEPRPLDLSANPEKFRLASIFDGRAGPVDGIESFMRADLDGGPRRWSASQLSELAACGFAYFAGRILMLREDDDPDYEQSALESGGMVHEVLADLFSHADLSDPAGFRRAAKEALERAHRRWRLDAREAAFFDLEWLSITAMVREAVEYELARRADGDIPEKMENECDIAFTLPGPAPDAAVSLQGRIDRLEIYRENNRVKRLKVVDYKMSRNLKAYADLLNPESFASHDLQMGVYALGAAARFRHELAPGAIIEASYIALKSRDKEAEPWPIPSAMLESDPAKVAAAAAKGEVTIAGRIAALVESVSAGRFDVDPLRCSDYCPHRRVCRYEK